MFELFKQMNNTLNYLQASQSHSLERISYEIDVLSKLSSNSVQGSSQMQANLEELSKRLREEAAKVSQVPKMRPNLSDPFAITATIIRPHEEESEHTAVRVQLDSGCQDDWISTKVVERAGLEPDVRQLEDEATFIGFGGQCLKPRGIVDVTWFAKNAATSRTTSFFVHDQVPFDMLLGRVFIKEESIFMLNEPALALRQSEFTKGTVQPRRVIAVLRLSRGASRNRD